MYVPTAEFDPLFEEAGKLLNVNPNEYDESIRHCTVRDVLKARLPDGRKPTLANLDLAVKRRTTNPDFVTWSSASTILGDHVNNPNFKLHTETQVLRITPTISDFSLVRGVQVLRMAEGGIKLIRAKAYIIACGAICTPQILWNSRLGIQAWDNTISPTSLGHYLCEQSLAFCQIVLSRDIVDNIPKNVTPAQSQKIRFHQEDYPADPIPIPFSDPEPQLTLRYTHDFPWHVQIHRDAFSYGDVGPKADSRVVVDLRWFGKSDVNPNNCVIFDPESNLEWGEWIAGVKDIYDMPQPTFVVERSAGDRERDQRMMKEMCEVASILGGYVPGSSPVFMEPGLALHITGTTRMGDPPEADQSSTSVVDSNSKVHGMNNLWLGGCGVIPDSTACNPTRTAIAYAIRSARSILKTL